MSVLESEDFKNYVQKRLANPDPEPFCPFPTASGYCNDAYSSKCYCCVNSLDDYICSKNTEINVFDEVETHENCTVQILRNSITGQTSVGWFENE